MAAPIIDPVYPNSNRADDLNKSGLYDVEKSVLDNEPEAVEASNVFELDPIREAKLTRKLDIYLIPVFCVRSVLLGGRERILILSLFTSCAISIGPTLETRMSPSLPSRSRWD